MASNPARPMKGDDSASVAARVREEIARRRLSRQKLADEARISLSTLEKALAGRRPFTLATIVRIEAALGLSLRRHPEVAAPPHNGAHSLAPDELGSYARPSVQWIEGSYVTIIPSFGEKSAVYVYRTDIAWDDARSCLAFRESERADQAFAHHGSVSVPNQTGHIYLVTNRHGQHRLAILARPTSTGKMHGILTTLQAGRGAHLAPVAVPIVLTPLAGAKDTVFGRVTAGQSAYIRYRALLRRTIEESFASFVLT